MKNIIILLILISTSLFSLQKSDVIKMAQIKLDKAIILSTVKSSKDIIPMEKVDIIDMIKAGVPNEVIKLLTERYLKSKTDKPEEVKKDTKKENKKVEEVKKEKTPEELAKEKEDAEKKLAEEKRIKEEELKKAEERIKKRKAQQNQRVYLEKRSPLERAKRYYKKKKYTKAIKKLDTFLKNGFEKSSNDYYEGIFYLGMSFYKMNNNYSAITYLKDVIIRGPGVQVGNEAKGTLFMYAFEAFAEMSSNWPFSSDFNDVYAMVSTYNIALLPKDFQDIYNYYMGKYYTKWASNPTQAEKYLSLVSTKSKLHASAEYLWGLTDVKSKKYLKSTKHFHNVLKYSKDIKLTDLAYIALGRVYYEVAASYFSVGALDKAKQIALASLDAYKHVSKDSPKLATAYYESSWAAFITGDYHRSIGYLHALHSSYLKNYYFPDKYILEAGIYVNMCRFKYAEEAISAYQKRYSALQKELETFLSEPIEAKEYNKILRKVAAGKQIKGKKRFSNELVFFIVSDGYFYENYEAMKSILKEKASLKKLSKNGKGSIKFLNELYSKLIKKEQKLDRSMGMWIRRKLQNAANGLGSLELKSDEIRFEIISAEKRVLMEQKAALVTNKNITKKSKEKVINPSDYSLADDEMMWDFNGEYWIDEIDNYHSFLTNKCIQ